MAKKVLVIEDDKDIRNTIVYVLEEQGYEVTSSEDSKILKSLDSIKPDLILLDNWLTEWKSDANGQQISKQLKSDPATSHEEVFFEPVIRQPEPVPVIGIPLPFLSYGGSSLWSFTILLFIMVKLDSNRMGMIYA